MNFVIACVTIEDVLILACEAEVALCAGQGAHIILVNSVLLGHDVQANADTLSDHLNLRAAYVTGVHLPHLLFLTGTWKRHCLLLCQ